MGFLKKLISRKVREPHRFLVKANNDLISFCKCTDALVGAPNQLSCPWCGCGWLWTCMNCRKAFTFARCTIIDDPWIELAKRDLRFDSDKNLNDDDLQDWVSIMQELLLEMHVDGEYVYLDGFAVPTDVPGIRAKGIHTSHDLNYVPQMAVLKDPSILESVLRNPEYWGLGSEV